MDHALPLDKMTIEEKIMVMESLWEDLCKEQDKLISPAWHESLLQERESLLDEGKDSFCDWSKAKKKIQDSIS